MSDSGDKKSHQIDGTNDVAMEKYPHDSVAVAGVILAYLPSSGFAERVALLAAQTAHVFVIVDDGQRHDDLMHVLGFGTAVDRVSVHPLQHNVGIAAALNVGANLATSAGYHWILTLDDDTLVHSDLVPRLIVLLKSAALKLDKPIACVGMRSVDVNSHEVSGRSHEDQRAYVEVLGNITSGNLTSLESVAAVGGFREEFFIDAVDYAYCIEAKQKGYTVVRGNDVGMNHTLGNASNHRFGPLQMTTTNHSALRRYYMFRNGLRLAIENVRTAPLYALGTVVFQVKTMFYLIFLEKDSTIKIKAAFRGLRDGWAGRMGPRQLDEIING